MLSVACSYLFVFWYKLHFCLRHHVCDYITYLILMKLCVAFLAPVCLHLHYRTPFRHPPSILLFPLIPLSSTQDRQDKVHQGFYFGDQLTLETFAAASSTKCNLVELCLPLKIRNPSLDPSRLHKIPQLESLTMCLTHRIAREPVKPP